MIGTLCQRLLLEARVKLTAKCLGSRAEPRALEAKQRHTTSGCWRQMAAVGFRWGGDGEMDKTDCGLGGELGREKCREMMDS